MSRTATPDQVIAHVDLLRAVDRLLEQAQVVREKRATLDRLITPPTDRRTTTADGETGGRDNG
jgi:hypothetical protein